MIIHRVEASRQLDLLLGRPQGIYDLSCWESSFRRLSDSQVGSYLAKVETEIDARRVLWHLSQNSEELSEGSTEDILRFISHDNELVRKYALRIILCSKERLAVRVAEEGLWSWDLRKGGDAEAGNLILAEFGENLSYEALRSRIAPAYLGYAIQKRGSREEGIDKFANGLHRIWQSLDRDWSSPTKSWELREGIERG